MPSAICLLSVVPMRKEPSHRSEMVSQLLFGEYVTMKEENGDFVQVICQYDGYEGWVQINQLTPVQDHQVISTGDFIGVFTEEVFVDWRCRSMPFAVPVYYPQDSAGYIQFGSRQVSYNVREDSVWKVAEKDFSRENLMKAVWVFLDTPYLWGGKSVFGIDCSGFSQQVFKLFGKPLLRDAYLQASQGSTVEDLQDADLGDLAFFQNEVGRITHVGILLSNSEIVHAAGKVRVDPIDKEGITNSETGKRTHQLHSIRRFVSQAGRQGGHSKP